MILHVDAAGTLRGLYDDRLDWRVLGVPTIRRASHVEPDAAGSWHGAGSANSGPVSGGWHRWSACSGGGPGRRAAAGGVSPSPSPSPACWAGWPGAGRRPGRRESCRFAGLRPWGEIGMRRVVIVSLGLLAHALGALAGLLGDWLLGALVEGLDLGRDLLADGRTFLAWLAGTLAHRFGGIDPSAGWH
jgi:hypothetical protein